MQEMLEMIMTVVIIPAIPIVVGALVKSLSKWVKKQSIQMENEVIESYLIDISEIVLQAVMHTSQTYADSLKEQGAFNLEAQEIAFQKTKETIMILLAQDAKDFITRMYGDLDLWLDTKIEQLVKELK